MAESKSNILVRFYTKPQKDEAATLKSGRPIFRDTEYISMRAPLDTTSEQSRPATPEDKESHRGAYEAFRRTMGGGVNGTLLSEWPAITRSQVEELAHFEVRTVERLASLSDQEAERMGGLHRQRTQARDYLEAAKGGAHVAQLSADCEALRERVKELQGESKALREELALLKSLPEEKPARGRGQAKLEVG